ncbi:TSUP family transporter [Paraferrimonas sp. SM1919]|uniref:TSUP family transporter n=1 Tax=Paraferrimonas sp. SM1919 TaxID=2662263 RepID=UPI001969F4D0|nr:TSUP family transporter [Paraferrimonas sp. SM1919]
MEISLEFILEPQTWLILAVIAFVAGFIDAIAGGGGLLTIPALLTCGLPPHLTLGTNKLAATFGSATASYAYFKKKLFNPLFWQWSFYATLSGACIGTLMVNFIDATILEKALPLLIISIAIYTFFTRGQEESEHTLPVAGKSLTIKQITQGLSLGFYDGFAGPGTGAFWTASSMALYKLNLLLSCGLARSMNFVSNFTSLIVFIYLGKVNWALGLTMGLCIMVGAFFGARFAIRFGSKFIRPIFITMVVILSLQLASEAWL